MVNNIAKVQFKNQNDEHRLIWYNFMTLAVSTNKQSTVFKSIIQEISFFMYIIMFLFKILLKGGSSSSA